MAHQGLRLALTVAVTVAIVGCAGGSSRPGPAPPPAATAPSGPPTFSARARYPRFHSTRFGLSLPLPEGKQWRIDDHSHRELRATHAPTRSEVRVYAWRERDLMNRARCEGRARDLGLVPDLDATMLEQEVVTQPAGWDGRVWLGLETRSTGAGKPTLIGHLMEFSARMRRCLFFYYRTEVPGGDERMLSARLAVIRLRVLGDLTVDSFGVVQRQPFEE